MTKIQDQIENEDAIILTKEQAIELLGKRKQIHTFVNPNGGMLLGADHSRKSMLKSIDTALRIEIGGPSCKAMGHGLILWTSKTNILFVEVDEVELQNLEDKHATRKKSKG